MFLSKRKIEDYNSMLRKRLSSKERITLLTVMAKDAFVMAREVLYKFEEEKSRRIKWEAQTDKYLDSIMVQLMRGEKC